MGWQAAFCCINRRRRKRTKYLHVVLGLLVPPDKKARKMQTLDWKLKRRDRIYCQFICTTRFSLMGSRDMQWLCVRFQCREYYFWGFLCVCQANKRGSRTKMPAASPSFNTFRKIGIHTYLVSQNCDFSHLFSVKFLIVRPADVVKTENSPRFCCCFFIIYFLCMLAADILSLSSKRVHAHIEIAAAFVHFMPEWQCESATHPSLLS